MDEKDFEKLFNWLKKRTLGQWMFFLCFLFLLIFSTPFIFTRKCAWTPDFSQTGNIGDTFGIMNPFIAVVAAVITFLAFWVQYQANVKMTSENRKQSVSNNFFEMLRMYKDDFGNLNFAAYLDELYSIIKVVEYKKERSNDEILKTLKKSYDIFFYGRDDVRCNYIEMTAFDYITDPSKTLSLIFKDKEEEEKLKYYYSQKDYFSVKDSTKELFDNKLYCGRKKELVRYYRHLFLMVKFVANSKCLTKTEKRELLRILRAQMSGEEQLMLFFNWMSGVGPQWEETIENFESNKKKDKPVRYNHFFTEYKMIHNIMPEQLEFFGSDYPKINAVRFAELLQKLCPSENLPPNIEPDPSKLGDDTIFEFEDWGDEYRFFKYTKES